MGLFSGIAGSIASSAAGGIIGAFTDPLTKITQTIASAKVDLEKEKNNEARIASEERIKGLEMKRDVLIAESASGIKLNALVRACFALLILIYLVKVVLFDTVFFQWTGWSTPPLPDKLDYIVTAVITFYFVYEVVDRVKR